MKIVTQIDYKNDSIEEIVKAKPSKQALHLAQKRYEGDEELSMKLKQVQVLLKIKKLENELNGLNATTE